MKIVIASCGSRGDVQPLLALALSLKARGHYVLLCTSPEHSDWIKDYGCPFQPIGNNVR